MNSKKKSWKSVMICGYQWKWICWLASMREDFDPMLKSRNSCRWTSMGWWTLERISSGHWSWITSQIFVKTQQKICPKMNRQKQTQMTIGYNGPGDATCMQWCGIHFDLACSTARGWILGHKTHRIFSRHEIHRRIKREKAPTITPNATTNSSFTPIFELASANFFPISFSTQALCKWFGSPEGCAENF